VVKKNVPANTRKRASSSSSSSSIGTSISNYSSGTLGNIQKNPTKINSKPNQALLHSAEEPPHRQLSKRQSIPEPNKQNNVRENNRK
jgi:hypothetical protein